MKTVVIIYVIDHNGQHIIGAADSNKSATTLVKKSGYGLDMSENELKLLEIFGYTTNREINFKFENWQVHGNLS